MIFEAPRHHPTFRRALWQSQRELSQEAVHSPHSARLLDAGELSERSLSELTVEAFERAVESLYQNAPLKGSLSYSISGAQFARDGATQIRQSDSDPVLILFERALEASAGTLPERIHTRIDFGLYEDGLLFGKSSYECEGGDFSSLNELIDDGLDEAALLSTLTKLKNDGVPQELAQALAQQLSEDLKPSMRAFALRSFPMGTGPNAKPLCALAEDLALRAELLENGVFYLDHQGGLMPGASAAQAIRLASERVSKALPLAGRLSEFKLKIGI